MYASSHPLFLVHTITGLVGKFIRRAWGSDEFLILLHDNTLTYWKCNQTTAVPTHLFQEK